MLRILHVSDLHITVPLSEHAPSMLQNLVKIVGQAKFDTEVNAKAWDPNKLESLTNRVVSIAPDMIVVTGDLTNYGDPESFDKAFAVVMSLKKECGAKHVLCVPGNHDTLADRSIKLRGKWLQKMATRGIGALIGEVDAINRAAERMLEKSMPAYPYPSLDLSRKRKGKAPMRPDLPFLTTYLEKLPDELAHPDPSQPIEVPLGWAMGLFFLINSNSVSALMANEGNAGIETINAIDHYASRNQSKFATSLKFAILHHHPISAPQQGVNAGERGYNWMKDGPRLLEFLHRRGFRFILHGHEHIPFDCTVRYGGDDEGLHIVAAGSALQSGNAGSFNVLELPNAYVAHRRRWDYTISGYEEVVPPLALTVRNLWSPRSTEIATSDDASLQNLMRVPSDTGNEYKTLKATVEITDKYAYCATYRYTGTPITEQGGLGPLLVFTGDPAMTFDEMKMTAIDNISGETLTPDPIEDSSFQKVVRLLYLTPRAPRDPQSAFDITVKFIWKAGEQTPHCWDLFNLAYYTGALEEFEYDLTLPSKPEQFRLTCRGLSDFIPKYTPRKAEQLADARWRWGFVIPKPDPVVAIIEFHLPDCRHKEK
jgi:3',5'-cyclic AMP phosphodiesterase CpdA